MKKRVRIYKADDGQGRVINPTAKWMAQIGGQQEAAAAAQQEQMLNQIYAYISESLMTGGDPEMIFNNLIKNGIDGQTANMLISQVMQQLQTSGMLSTPEETTVPEIVTEAADNIQEPVETPEEEAAVDDMVTGTEPSYDEAEQYMEDSFMQTGGEQAMIDAVLSQYSQTPVDPSSTLEMQDMVESLAGAIPVTPSYNSITFPTISDYMIPYKPVSELKKGGKVAKKKGVKEILSYFDEGGDVENDKIGRGNMMDTSTDEVSKKKQGFINSVKQEARTAKAEELYDMMSNSMIPSVNQTAQQFAPNQFMQGGGYIDSGNPDLYKFVYGGDEDVEPYYEADFLPEAQTGQEIRKATINYIPQRRTVPGGAFRSLFPFNPIRSVRYTPFTFTLDDLNQIPLTQKNLKRIYKGKGIDIKEKRQRLTKEERQAKKDSKIQTRAPFYRPPGWKGTTRPNRFEQEEFDVYDPRFAYTEGPLRPESLDASMLPEEYRFVQPEQEYLDSKNWLRDFIKNTYFAKGGPLKMYQGNEGGSSVDIGLSPDGSPAIEGLPESSLYSELTQSTNVPTNPQQQPIQYEVNEYMGGEGTPFNDPKQMFGILKETTTDPEAGVMAFDTALNATTGFAERFQTPKPKQFYGEDIASSPSKKYNLGTWDVNSGLFRPDETGFQGVVQKGGSIYQEGGETYMSEEQIRDFIANGGEIEFI